jgi:Cutinase
MVLGGYSQGAVVMDLITEAMPPDVANHVAAVAVFGNPSPTSALSRTLSVGRALPAIGPLYTQDHRHVRSRRSHLLQRWDDGAARSLRAERND